MITSLGVKQSCNSTTSTSPRPTPATTDRRYANEIAYEIRERGRWARVGNIDPFYYKGDVVYFEEGKYPDGNSDFVAGSFDELAGFYKQNYGADLYERYQTIGLDPNNLTGRPVYKDGMFTHLKGIGWVVDDYHCAQISLNLTNYKVTPPQDVLEATTGNWPSNAESSSPARRLSVSFRSMP